MKKLLVFIIIILASIAVRAEINGTVSVGTVSTPIVTGLWGKTVSFCNTTSDCMSLSLSCFIDFDGVSSSPNTGWCNVSSITSCYANGTVNASGTSTCSSIYLKQTCSSGNWTTTDCSTTNQTCSAGACVSTSTTSASSSDTTTTNTTKINKTTSIGFSSVIASFDALQNSSITKQFTIKNTGNYTLYNISISVEGPLWWKLNIANLSALGYKLSQNIVITFLIPPDAELKEHNFKLLLSTSNKSVSNETSFNIRALPSNKTVEQVILPKYDDFLIALEEFEKNITWLEFNGYNITSSKAMLNRLKSRIDEIKSFIASKNYFSANQAIAETNDLINDIKKELDNPVKLPFDAMNFLVIIVIAIIIVASVVIAYLFWPVEEEGYTEWKPSKKKRGKASIKQRIKELFKKDKNDVYEYKK